LPDVEEGTSYGTPAFRFKGKLIARLHEEMAVYEGSEEARQSDSN
jgi:hypothetical protein